MNQSTVLRTASEPFSSSPTSSSSSPSSQDDPLKASRSRSVNFSGDSAVASAAAEAERRKRLQRTPTPYWPRKELSDDGEGSDWSRQSTLEDVDETDKVDTELHRHALFRRGLERQRKVSSRDASPVSKFFVDAASSMRSNSLQEAVQGLPDKLRKTIVRNASLGAGGHD
jgi:hypothetical protein